MKRLGEIVGGENVSEKKALIEGTCDDWIEGQIMDPKKRRHRLCSGTRHLKNFKFFLIKIKYHLYFLNCFNILILKIIFKK